MILMVGENIHKVYRPGEPEVRAFKKGVDLVIESGSFVPIIPSDSGKTTRFNLSGGLDKRATDRGRPRGRRPEPPASRHLPGRKARRLEAA